MNLTPKIQKAINKATILHLNQIRKGSNLPYITHPYSVAFILSNYTNNENIIIAGLLHDVLEDVKDYNSKDLEKDFGKEITKIVKEVSEDTDPNHNSKKKKETWKYRKEQYIKDLKNDSFEAQMVCAADKIHNLRSLMFSYKKEGDKMWKHFNSSKEESLWFYKEVLNILKEKLDNKIVKELEKTYQETKNCLN
jgi:(p)ppGpp synthase/HD superfamily hydrolase